MLGFVLGGKLGIITILTALAAGPVIQFLAEIVQNKWKRQDYSAKDDKREVNSVWDIRLYMMHFHF